ncbi:MAG TPA: cytochrome ubiquinol oxidase subunit I, partial [Ensifer sp.]|nr:cytochrome ubiquinol oxidase subunit I [Ensifer sp.]
LLLTVKAVVLAGLCGVGAIVAIMVWMWECDQAPAGEIDIGGGIRLPSYASGPVSHSWWAMVVLMLVAAALYLSYIFGYLYLWIVAPKFWPRSAQLPALAAMLAPAALLILSLVLLEASRRLLDSGSGRHGFIAALLLLGAIALVGALGADVLQHWHAGLRPQASGYAGMVYANAALQAQIAGAVLLTAGFAAARLATGQVDRVRRVVFDNLALLWAYSLGQAAFGLVLTYGFPRLVAV